MSLIPVITPQLFDINYKWANDPPFPFLRRISNSPGRIYYTSSNTNIADISAVEFGTIVDKNGDVLRYDNVIVIKGVRAIDDLTWPIDSVTLTVFQEASGNYAAATMTSTLYIRKVYPTLSGFRAPTGKTFTSPPFLINPPITNNVDGAFVYNSSNTSVATIIGDGPTITVTGVGSTIIMAYQLPTTKFFKSENISFTLVVDKAIPVITGVSNLTKLVSDKSFIIPLPTSTNNEIGFTYASTETSVITVDGNVATIINSGQTTIIISQPENDHFYRSEVRFNVYVYESIPNVNSCNFNYSNPYQSQFWSRYTPVSYYPDFTQKQLDERRKVEILKHKTNSGNSTKAQRYALASRSQLIRKKGFAVQTDTYTNPNTSGLPVSGNTLVCNRTPVLCGSTSACDVPGKEMTLCYDPNVPLYNYIRPYTYKAGLQTTTNIPTLALTPPTDLTGQRGNNKISISWLPPTSNGGYPIVSYTVTYSLDNKNWTVFTTIPFEYSGGYQYLEVTGLQNNSLYYIRVYAANKMGPSAYPATIVQRTFSVPSIPSRIALIGGRDISIPVSWTKPTDDGGSPIIGYKLEYTTDVNGLWESYSLNNESNPNVEPPTTYIITGITNQTLYYVRVSPYNNVGYGPVSQIVSTSTMQAPGAPTALYAVAAYSNILTTGTGVLNDHNIRLSWVAPINNGGSDIAVYSVDYSYDLSTWVNLTTSQPASNPTYWLTNLNGNSVGSGITFHFRVFARNASILGPSSNIYTVKTVTTPSQPYNLYEYATRDAAGIYLGFSMASNGGSQITSINVYYSRDGAANVLYTQNIYRDIGVGILSVVLPATNQDGVLLFDESIYYITVFVTNILGESAQSSQVLTVQPVQITTAVSA